MKIETEVLAVLGRAQINGAHLVLPEQLDRKLYERANKVLVAAGGVWKRGAKAHVFQDDATAVIEQILVAGEIASQQDFGAFFSPATVADRVIALGDLHPGMTVIEPNAGRGAIASRALLAGCVVDCVELQQRNVDILCSTPYRQVVQADFLSLPPAPRYDRALANPPFSRQDDIRHVLHALKFLVPGGLLVSVMSAGVSYRDNRLTQDFRDLVRSRGGDIEALPEAAFKETGTLVSTVIVTIPAER